MIYLQNLLQAAREGNIESINLCLQNNADIDYQEKHVSTTVTIYTCTTLLKVNSNCYQRTPFCQDI